MVEMLMIKYTTQGTSSLKAIMGTQEGQESPQDTLIREFGEEAIEPEAPGVPGEFRCEYFDRPIVYTFVMDDELNSRGLHVKIFQLIKLVSGKLRTEDMPDTTKRFPVLLGPPQWIEAKVLIETMRTDQRTKRVHFDAVRYGLASLAARDRHVADRYADLISDLEPFRPDPMVLEYLKRFR